MADTMQFAQSGLLLAISSAILLFDRDRQVDLEPDPKDGETYFSADVWRVGKRL